jgi:uncharacterized protein
VPWACAQEPPARTRVPRAILGRLILERQQGEWIAGRPLKQMDEESHSAVVVPHTELQAELLRSVIESFVLREGTDYGEREFSLEDKVRRVMRQIERGEAQIVFDSRTDSVTIASARPEGVRRKFDGAKPES